MRWLFCCCVRAVFLPITHRFVSFSPQNRERLREKRRKRIWQQRLIFGESLFVVSPIAHFFSFGKCFDWLIILAQSCWKRQIRMIHHLDRLSSVTRNRIMAIDKLRLPKMLKRNSIRVWASIRGQFVSSFRAKRAQSEMFGPRDQSSDDFPISNPFKLLYCLPTANNKSPDAGFLDTLD